MATNETPRFQIPYPAENDPGSWYTKFQTTLTQFDTRVFANLEGLKPVFNALPMVENHVGVPRQLIQTGDWVLISRTFQSTCTVAAAATEILQDAMLCVRMAAGAVDAQTAIWEVVQNGATIDADLTVWGYVDVAWNIWWWNGTMLAPTHSSMLFGGGVSGSILSGAGNPNGVVAGFMGQVYVDVTVPGAEIFYMNTSGGTVWFVI